MLLNPAATFDLAQRLRAPGGAPIGEVFSFLSGLYFRGKLMYAQRFAVPPHGLSGAWVITSSLGLLPVETVVTLQDLKHLGEFDIDLKEARYVSTLKRDAEKVLEKLGATDSAILLGSIATAKYLHPLTSVFGARLLFPASFAGRGDLSRGGLLLRSARSGDELSYVQAESSSTHHGPRPAKLNRYKDVNA